MGESGTVEGAFIMRIGFTHGIGLLAVLFS